MADWLNVEVFANYESNLHKVEEFNRKIIKALLATEIFVLISDPEGTDMFIELGICLAHKELSGKKRIYIVGKHSRRSLMQLHPDITHVNSLEEVLDAEAVQYDGFAIPALD